MHATRCLIISVCLILATAGIIAINISSLPFPAQFIEGNKVESTTQATAVDLVVFDTNITFPELADSFEELAWSQGGAHAFQVMLVSELPPNIDTHLLGHVVGDVLYAQEGLAGMSSCTDDFRNACSHSIVIGALLDNGMQVFDEIHEICESAPGDSGTSYNMCFHGFGHGVLAYAEFDLEEATELCLLTGSEAYDYYESSECFGGVIMEIHAGIHDRILWERNGKPYIDYDDPKQLCEHDFIPDSLRTICYVYLTPFIFDLYAAGEFPQAEHFYESFSYCASVEDDEYRQACYGGIGKELPGLLMGRNVALIGTLTETDMRQVESWCRTSPSQEGYDYCVQYVLGSLYWGGENPYQFAAQFCELVQNPESWRTCFSNLHYLIGLSMPAHDRSGREAYCAALPDAVQEDCHAQLLL